VDINLTKIWWNSLEGISANTWEQKNMKEKPPYLCLDWGLKTQTQCWSGLRKHIAVPYLLSTDYYFLKQKRLNHAQKLPLSSVSLVSASHSLLSAPDGVNVLYTGCIWYGQYFNSGHNEILLREVMLVCPHNPTRIVALHNVWTLRKTT
jgi:hypothetical protein